MKNLIWLVGISGLLLSAGCTSPKAVSKMYGRGSKQVFNQEYETVWAAANGAAMMEDRDLRHADLEHGYLSVRRITDANSFGENIGIWVKAVGPKQTEVQVVSRATGPNLQSANRRQMNILKHIATMLEESG